MSTSISNFFIKKDLDNNIIVTCLGYSKQIRDKINELSRKISVLNLSCCKINETNLIELAEILEKCVLLESLKLNLNGINIDEAIIIATVITNCPNLKELDFSNNNIILEKNSDKTFLLINKLKECSSLINLNLSCNSIIKENIMEFEKNLPDCTIDWTYY
jgi:hypothetical protein